VGENPQNHGKSFLKCRANPPNTSEKTLQTHTNQLNISGPKDPKQLSTLYSTPCGPLAPWSTGGKQPLRFVRAEMVGHRSRNVHRVCRSVCCRTFEGHAPTSFEVKSRSIYGEVDIINTCTLLVSPHSYDRTTEELHRGVVTPFL
jgi:hypothetical protein